MSFWVIHPQIPFVHFYEKREQMAFFLGISRNGCIAMAWDVSLPCGSEMGSLGVCLLQSHSESWEWPRVTATAHTWKAPPKRYLAKNLWSEMFTKHLNIEKYIYEAFCELLICCWNQLCGNHGQTYHWNRWWILDKCCVQIQPNISILQQRHFICTPPNEMDSGSFLIYLWA